MTDAEHEAQHPLPPSYDVGAGVVREGDTAIYDGNICKVLTVYQDGDVQVEVTPESCPTVKWRYVIPITTERLLRLLDAVALNSRRGMDGDKRETAMTDVEHEAQVRLLGIQARDQMCDMEAGNVNEQACKIDRRTLIGLLAKACAERDEAHAEIARINETHNGHDQPCLICGQPCNGLVGDPSLWPIRLGNQGYHHIGCVNESLHKLEQLSPPLALRRGRAQMREEAAALAEAFAKENPPYIPPGKTIKGDIGEIEIWMRAVLRMTASDIRALPDEPPTVKEH